MPPRKYSIFIFLLLFSVFGWSQPPEQYSFTHYRLTDGLASNVVNNMVQDETGFLWLATNNGLQRFDGNKFITFNSNKSNARALPSNEVTQVYRDRHQNLWVTTADNKVGIFNTHSFQYTEVPFKQWSREKVNVDKEFMETADGTLLLLCRKTRKLFQYDASSGAFVPSNLIPFPNNWEANYIFQDKPTQKFVLATDSGFVVYNSKTKAMAYHEMNPENDPIIANYGNERFINYMFIDANRRMFFEHWPKMNKHPDLHLFDMNSGEKRKFDLQKEYGLSYHQIKGVLEQRNGKLWLFGLPFLAEYNGGSDPLYFLKKDYNKERTLKFNVIYSMFEDRQQNLWLCSDYGVYLFNPGAQLFHNYTLTTPKRFMVEGRSQSALQLPNGEIWIGYRDLGVFRYNNQLQPLPLPVSLTPLVESKSVWDIHLHRKTGKIWMALQGGNLIVYDTATKKAQLLSPEPFEQRAITQIAEDKEGNLWFGTQAGNLVKWNFTTSSKNVADAFVLVKKTGMIEKLFADNRGNIWVAAYGEGLLKINPINNNIVSQINENSTEGFQLWNNNPKDIFQYNDSLLIVASGAINIINLNNLKVRHISWDDGLPSNTVQSVQRDDAGMLWLGTLNGLCMMDMKKLSFTNYNQNNGLLNEGFNVAGAHRLKDGRLLFMTEESFLVFDPSLTRKKDTINKPYITEFKLMNTSLPVDSLMQLSKINLGYNRTNVVIEFSALNYNQLAKLDYYYQLENFDSTWIKSDERHQAIYTFLPPGNYRFKVKTRNVEGKFSAETAYLQLVVSPPFWRTWWFYTLVVFLAIAIFYLIYRERMKRLISLQNVRSDIAGQLHQDVSSTLNNINVLSQIAKLKAEKDIVRSKELIDEISGKSYDMMVSMDEILWSIDPTNDTMEKTLLRIIEFSKTLETAYGASIDIVVQEKVKDLRLEMKLRHGFFILCKESLQYLARNAAGSNIMVDVDLVWSKIVIKILSVGAETDENALPLLQFRKSLKEKTTSLHGQLTFETGKRDMSIILTIPVR